MRIALAFIAIVFCAQGCVSVHPAEHPAQPVAVYLADYGIHSGVIMPTTPAQGAPRQYVEYCYGDWPFAVENRDNPCFDGPRALFFSFQSGFGRRFMSADGKTGRPAVPHSDPALKKVTRFYAAQSDVAAMLQQLDARYRAGQGPPKTNEKNGNIYVRDSQHYSLVHNCNHLTAEILHGLGCHISGIVVTSSFTIDQPADAGAPVPSEPLHASVSEAATAR